MPQFALRWNDIKQQYDPNCRYRFAIFSANAYTKNELEEFSRQSMQPFTDTRFDAECKAYAAEQVVNRKCNESLWQYNEVKTIFA